MSFLEQTSSVTINDTRISYFHMGKGQPILCLHGNPGTKQDYSGICAELSNKQFGCYSLDRPGHMNSQELIVDDSDTWADVDTFAEFIEKKCNNKATVVGYSLGSFLALKLALKYPEKVANLVLVAPFIVPDDKKVKISSIPKLSKNFFLGTFFGVLLPHFAQDKMKMHFDNVYHPIEVPDEYYEKYLPRFTRFEAIIATMTDKNTMVEVMTEVHDRLSEIKCPVSVISGMQDKVCSQKNQLELLKSKIADIKVVEIEDAGHAIPFTHAIKIAEIIKEVS